MTPFVKILEEIIAAAGQTESFKTNEHYHIKIPNKPYMDLAQLPQFELGTSFRDEFSRSLETVGR